jgi:hypothetical protein
MARRGHPARKGRHCRSRKRVRKRLPEGPTEEPNEQAPSHMARRLSVVLQLAELLLVFLQLLFFITSWFRYL